MIETAILNGVDFTLKTKYNLLINFLTAYEWWLKCLWIRYVKIEKIIKIELEHVVIETIFNLLVYIKLFFLF